MPSDDELFRRYLEEIEQVPPLSAEEETRLARLAAAGDDAASQRLVQGNLQLVVALARRYRATGVPLLDLVQEGNLGLLQAVQAFDPDKGFRFSTFATWWIRQAIAKSIEEDGGTIALGVVTRDELTAARLQEVWDGFVAHEGRQPSLAELATDLGVSEDAVRRLLEPPPDLLAE
jgi:RNA polymerase primary sigma factor